MTDIISTIPVEIRSFSLPLSRLRRIGVVASLNAMTGLLGQALNLAYADPYNSLQRKSPVVPDIDLNGRDPNW